MELDILYVFKNDLLFRSINKFKIKDYFDLIFYDYKFNDSYLNKKNIFSLINLLNYNGVCCVKIDLHNISEVINFCSTNGYKHKVIFSSLPDKDIYEENLFIFVVIYKNNARFNLVNFLNFDGKVLQNTVGFLINIFSKLDVPVLLAADSCKYISIVKNLCRYVVAIDNSTEYIETARSQSIFIEEV